uniref:Uncharacterized protein n=1 Tax=Peronospora matthiolae TaxID=2874970 RepID=A0AAV1TLH0_9STRA
MTKREANVPAPFACALHGGYADLIGGNSRDFLPSVHLVLNVYLCASEGKFESNMVNKATVVTMPSQLTGTKVASVLTQFARGERSSAAMTCARC